MDKLQVILWSLTYLLIVYHGVNHRKERKIMMPLLAGTLNFAWEINAVIASHGFLGHIVWISLDVVIILLNIYNIKSLRRRILYLFSIIVNICILGLFFKIPVFDGVLVSVFVIDLIMALDFVINAKKISKYGKITIAITKLFGDLFAWFAYSRTWYVNVAGVIVFLVNLYYLSMCLEMSAINPKRKASR